MTHTPNRRYAVGDHVRVNSPLSGEYTAQIITVLAPEPGRPRTLYELGTITPRSWPLHRWPKIHRHHHLVVADALTPAND